MEKRDLSTKKLAAIRALVGGSNHEQAAKAAHCHPNRITDWLKDPDFTASLRQAEGEALDVVSRQLLTLARLATNNLLQVLESNAPPGVRIRAADVVLSKLLQVRELVDLEARISVLELAQQKKEKENEQ